MHVNLALSHNVTTQHTHRHPPATQITTFAASVPKDTLGGKTPEPRGLTGPRAAYCVTRQLSQAPRWTAVLSPQ